MDERPDGEPGRIPLSPEFVTLHAGSAPKKRTELGGFTLSSSPPFTSASLRRGEEELQLPGQVEHSGRELGPGVWIVAWAGRCLFVGENRFSLVSNELEVTASGELLRDKRDGQYWYVEVHFAGDTLILEVESSLTWIRPGGQVETKPKGYDERVKTATRDSVTLETSDGETRELGF